MTQRSRAQAVLAILAVIVALGIALELTSIFQGARSARTTTLPFWRQVGGIALITAAAQTVSVRYRSQSAGSIVLSLGLFTWSVMVPFVSPDALMFGGAAGYFIHELAKRAPWIKLVFNVGLAYTSVGVLVNVQQLVSGGQIKGPLAWLATLCAILAASTFQVVGLRPAMAVYEGGLDRATRHRHLANSLMVAAVTGMFAAVFHELWLSVGTSGAFLAIGMVATLGVGMRLMDQRGGLVHDLEDAVATMAHREVTDGLTSLPNRTGFQRAFAQAAALEEGVGVLVVDLRRFREINETLGFETGDRLLVEVARRLVAVARPGDTVARLGGDEFAVVLHSATDAAVARLAADRYLGSLEAPYDHDGLQVQTSASIGIARGGVDGEDADTLLRRAEVAMHAAKAAGEGHALFEAGMEADAPRRVFLAGELAVALDQGALTLAYQPKMELATGRVVGVEALARWEHPSEGFISPGEFIPIAERTGLVRPLTRHVLRQALDDASAWRREGVDLTISVNISPSVLTDVTFSDHLAAEILRSNLPASSIVLEVTESVVLSDSARIEEMLRRIEELGVKLSIDDYGTGYSSLSYLRRMRVDELKVDRSFVTDMIHNANDAVLVESTIKLGHALGLSVVAEGVEDGPTMVRLEAMGCDLAQGYHIARPMPASKLLAFVLHPTSDNALGDR